MENFKINNQAKLIRSFVNNNIDYINRVLQKKPLNGSKKYDEEYFDDLIKKAIDAYEVGNGFHEELKQKLSPLKLSILMLENQLNNPDGLSAAIINIQEAFEELENSVKHRFEDPKLIRFVKKVDVLYIEDNALERKTIDTFFKTKGIDIKSVETSDEALYLLNTLTPKIILADINLKTSKMNGDELCQMIKSKAEYKSIPIILISAVISKNEEGEIRSNTGADDIIIKPINKLADLEIIFKHLKQM
ncbi:MAG: response regulator [Candidatus Lokiarchaeota archaeon]|nr:response regulator [Candidatus Lokiarchaeota archaeon]